MKPYELFNKGFTRDALTTLFVEKVSMYTSSGIDGMTNIQFEKDLDFHINTILRKVLSKTYNFAVYKGKLISKGYKKATRIVEKPIYRDRLVLRAIYNILEEIYRDNLKKRSLHSQVKDLTNQIKKPEYDFLIRLDVKEFYPTIDHNILIKMLRKKIHKLEMLELIQNAITTPNDYFVEDGIEKRVVGVPQGLSIANVLANIYLMDFDAKYESIDGIKYFRYVDDILILCNSTNSITVLSEVQKDIGKLKIKLNDGDKFVYDSISIDFDYLGYRISNRLVSVRANSLQKLRESIIRLLTSYKYKKEKNEKYLLFRLNLRVTGCIWDNKKYGWMFFFSKIENENVLHSLDLFINKQLRRFGFQNIKVKKLVRTYYEINHNIFNTNYIPKFDMYTEKDISLLLDEVGISYRNAIDARIKFLRLLKKETTSLERDMAQFS